MKLLVAIALVALNGVRSAQVAEPGPTKKESSSKLWIEGGSNLRDWSCQATALDARVDAEPAAHAEGAMSEMVKRVSIKTVVRGLKCGNARMEKDLYRALKADDPSSTSEIVGVFTATPGSRDSASVDTEGTITVAGVDKTVRLRIALERLADGTVRASGALPLLMTDFGVTPPTGLFGLVRSHNEIVVRFELNISPP